MTRPHGLPHTLENDTVPAAGNLDTKCLIYKWGKTSAGYGMIRTGTETQSLAHRYFYEKSRGQIPPGMSLDHACREVACCNPWHLEIVTHAENLRRGRGTRLTREQVLVLREYAKVKAAHGQRLPNRALQAAFGVRHITEIAHGLSWMDINAGMIPGLW